MKVRSNKANVILRDLTTTIERTVRYDLTKLNTLVKRQTPIRTGYARRSWRISRNYGFGYSGPVLENRAQYIGILDRGRVMDKDTGRYSGSKQAPKGIVQPVVDRLIRVRRKI